MATRTTKIWNQHKENIVYQANLAKFSQHEDLKQILLDSGNKLIVEVGPKDGIWGVGLAADDDEILDTDKMEWLKLAWQSHNERKGRIKKK